MESALQLANRFREVILNGKWIAKDTRTKEQKISLLNLLTTLKSIYGDDVTIHGHREFAAKSCPCFDAYEEYKHL